MKVILSISLIGCLFNLLHNKLNKDGLELLRKYESPSYGFISYTVHRTFQDSSIQIADCDFLVNSDSLVLINSNKTASIFYNNWSMNIYFDKQVITFSKYNPVPDYLFDPIDYTSYIEVSIEYADSVFVTETDTSILTSVYLINNGLRIEQINFYEKAESLKNIEIIYSLYGSYVYDKLTFYNKDRNDAEHFLSTFIYSMDTVILDKKFNEYRYLNFTSLNIHNQ